MKKGTTQEGCKGNEKGLTKNKSESGDEDMMN